MLILALDTSTRAGSIAVLRDSEVLGQRFEDSDEQFSSRLFRQLEELLGELSLKLAAVDLFGVVSGPGSFTGLRVGLTAVKAWAEVYGKPISAVSGLEAVAAQSHSEERFLAPVFDARRGQVFGGLYERGSAGLIQRGDDVVMGMQEYLDEVISRIGQERFVLVTTTPEKIAAALPESSLWRERGETVSPVLAPAVGQLAWQRAQEGRLVDALTLDAHYIRRSDAELFWKGA